VIKKTIEYEDYNGNKQVEDFYFNLTKREIVEMEIAFEGGLRAYIEKLQATSDGPEMYHLFKKIILEAHGVKSPDGKRFWKEDPDTGRLYAKDFIASPAMDELILGFLDGEKGGNDAAEFVRGLLPERMVAEAEAEARKDGSTTPELPTAPPVLDEKKEPSDEELIKMNPKDMTHEQLQRAYVLKNQQ
jgi:hypothetical protein